ncbi:MAG: 30S ribosomal protein S17 [Armatimonadota bacterium]
MSEATAEQRSSRKSRDGRVTSNSMDKTVVVEVMRLVRHPLYKRVVRRSTRYAAHDEENECGVGDRVRIRETRPLSKTKRWAVVQILEKAK